MNRPHLPVLTAASVALVASALLALLVLPHPAGDSLTARGGAHSSTPSAFTPGATGAPTVPGGSGPSGGLHGAGSGTGFPDGTPTPNTTATGRPGGGPLLIGVPVPDLSVVRSLGPAYDLGPIEKEYEAVAAAYRRRHQLPVAGRDIRFVFRTFDVLDDSDQRRVCTQLVDDDHVFAVVPALLFAAGAQCTSGEKRVPTVSGDLFTQQELRAAAPQLFSVSAELGRLLRHQADWMIANGLVKGHRVGLYYSSVPDTAAKLVRDQFIATLKARGYDLAAEVTTSDGTAGGPTDAVAVQRFRSAKVDVALLLVSPLAKSNFLQSAQTQRYFPVQVTNDWALDTSTTGAGTYPKQAFDGAWGMTSYRNGEIEAGIVTPRTAQCLADYRAATGRPQPDPHSGELPAVLGICDVMDVLLAGLQAAGPDLSQQALLAGLPHVTGLSLAGSPTASFTAGTYDGLNSVRTIRWHADCTCWKAVGAFQELPR